MQGYSFFKNFLRPSHLSLLLSIFVLISFVSPMVASAQSVFYTGSTVTDFPAGNVEIKTFPLNKTADIQMNIHINQAIQGNINNTGIKDIFGISLSKISTSGEIAISDSNLNDAKFTDTFLRSNRASGNDTQAAYSAADTPVKAHSGWDAYQCAEQWIKEGEYKVGTDYKLTCQVPLIQCGIYQVDINSYSNYSSLPVQYQSPDTGHAGVLVGYFFKVPCVKSTPTPTPTQTPKSIALVCNAITFKDIKTGNVIANGSAIQTIDNQPLNLQAQITGTANISPISLNWSVIGEDANTNKKIDESSQSATKVNTTNEHFTSTFDFKFGPFNDNKSLGAKDIAPSHNFVYNIIPALTYTKDNSEINLQTSPACNGNLNTTSIGKVLGKQTNASVAIVKTLFTSEPISVGQTAVFKILITNNGTEALQTLNFHDDFGNDGIMNLQSATAFETINGVASTTQSIPLTSIGGTTNTIDLASIVGFRALQPNDSLTINLDFIGESQGNSCDVAVINTISQSGATPTATDHACAIFSPAQSSPNTGAETNMTIGAIGTFLLALLGKKHFLKILTV